jgi:hypothetical protein
MIQATRLGEIISKVGEVVIVLSDKRVTLEEKMIRMYLHEVAAVAGRSASLLHLLTTSGAYPDKQFLTNLESVVVELITALDELLKMARYDPNVLEQYFEHDFYDKMRTEQLFIERLQDIETKLSAQLATAKKAERGH